VHSSSSNTILHDQDPLLLVIAWRGGSAKPLSDQFSPPEQF